MQKAYKLLGKHRHYDWGGHHFIPNLMGIENNAHQPFAEYWMGAHASAAAEVITQEGVIPLDQMIKKETSHLLGLKTYTEFGMLPYLFKILDVSNMLSIQAHPNKKNAIIGFEKEQASGISLDAFNRNYKDRNHKPEVMVALSDFWLLHGFLAPELLEQRLQAFFYFQPLQAHFSGVDYEGLYRYFMQLSIEDADLILKPLMMDAVASVKSGSVDKTHPHWWANQYYDGKVPDQNIDKGIFSIYILNIVQLSKYEGIFQGAGLLHAYLEGQNIELMANSDNVLRGGLSSKYIDINELLQQVQFKPTYPDILKGQKRNDFETDYPCPVPDFGITKIAIPKGESYAMNSDSLEILWLMEGELQLEELLVKAGEAVMIPTGQHITITAIRPSVLFKSYVP